MPAKKEIEKLAGEITSLVMANRLKEALTKLNLLMEGMHVADFTLQYENLDQTYRMLLEYTFRGVPDPQRDRIFHSLKISTLELADLVQQKALSNTGMHIFSLKAQIEKEKETARDEAARRIDSMSFDKELQKLLHECDVIGNITDPDCPHITPRLFQILWFTDKYVEDDLRLVDAIRSSESLPWYEKSLAVSAVTLSLLNCFDKEKFLILLNFYDDREEQVWQRAITGLVIAIYYYGQRVELYPAIANRLSLYKDDPEFFTHIRQVLIQIFKARETEKLTSKFKDEILPDVKKFESKIREKLDLDNLISDDMIENQNPDWEKLFEDSPDLLGKIEKMSEMQMEGLDLFMGTFAMLKNFDFFRELSNWFRPFYKENEIVRQSVTSSGDRNEAFLAGMEESFYMCNSDKYSFCLNISQLPEDQSEKVKSLFIMEAESLHDINEEDEILHKPERATYVFTQYIQDLYRFYKLHPFRNDFRDVFGLSWDITVSELFDILAYAPEVLKSAGQFLFEKEHYPEAIRIFEYLSKLNYPEQEVIEKLAFSYQLMGDFRKALEYYKKVEIFESNRMWSIKKIIYCLRMLKETETALKWCREAEQLAPDDVYIHTMTGNCYLEMQNFESDLEHYFRVEFLAPDNKKVLRPIAWCCFVLGKLEMARNYMNTILKNDPNAQDFINAGHVEFCLFNKTKAMEYYQKAINEYDTSFARFNEILASDQEFLLANGVNPEEIPMISDYIRYK